MLDAIFRKIENLKSKKFNVFRSVKESTSVVQYTKTYKSKNSENSREIRKPLT